MSVNQGPAKRPDAQPTGSVGHALVAARANTQTAAAPPAAAAATTSPAPAPAAQPTKAPAMNTTASSGSRPPLISLRNGPRLAAPISRTRNAEVLAKLLKAGEELIKNTDTHGFQTVLVPIDMESTNRLTVSVLAVALQREGFENLGWAYHVLILAASQPGGIPPKFENVGGQQIEIIRTPGDADDDVMGQVVLERLQARLPGHSLASCEAEVVPVDFNTEDEGAVRDLFAGAALACATYLQENSSDFQPLNWANVAKDTAINVRPVFGGGQIKDRVGMPTRADILIELQAAPLNPQNNSGSINAERPDVLSAQAGFLDLVYAPVNDPNVMAQNVFAQQNVSSPTTFQTYEPRYIMTDLQVTLGGTLEDVLFAIASTPLLRENNMWAQALKSQPGAVPQGEIDRHDIGAVGIEVNFQRTAGSPEQFGTKIDTKDATFTPENFAQLVNLAFVPRLRISIDVPECGPQSWYLSAFSAAAEGNPKAIEALLGAANSLTNGSFQKYFDASQLFVTDELNRIHLGTYVDSRGQLRDIRDVDYLMVANVAGSNDPRVIKDWSDTFNRTEFPLVQRLAARKRIMAALVGEANLNITGFARRVTISYHFLEALLKGLQEQGLIMRQIGQDQSFGSYQRAIDQFGAFNMPAGNSSMYSRNSTYGNTAGAGYGRPVRGW